MHPKKAFSFCFVYFSIVFCLWEIVEAYELHGLNSVSILTSILTITLTREVYAREPEKKTRLSSTYSSTVCRIQAVLPSLWLETHLKCLHFSP